MKVGLFSPYLMTMGGGERYFLTVAEFFLKRGDQVDIFWRENVSQFIKNRFGISLEKASFKSKFSTFGYDLIFFVSDGSLLLSFAKKTIIHFQVPFTNVSLSFLDKIKLLNSTVVCNSKFTKGFIDNTYNVNSVVLYPPVDVESFNPGKKENIILGVGRFFAPLHPKKQEILVNEFLKLNLTGWELVLIGGVTGKESQKSVGNLKKKVAGSKIRILTDLDFSYLINYYAKAKIFWHAAGFGEDLENHPEKAEHFGMTTVEAMAAGAVPVVFAGGGQPEIVTDGENGLLWDSSRQLAAVTNRLISDPVLLKRLSQNAVQRSTKFSKQRFFDEMEALL